MQTSAGTWPRIPVGELLERVVRPVRLDPDQEYQEIGIRSHCKGIFHKPRVTGREIGSKRVYWVEPGCLIFNIIFAWEQAVAITTKKEHGLIASHRFPMYRSINGELLPEYAYLYFASPRGKHDLMLASPGGAGRNKTLGQDELLRLRIPLPSPPEQRRIVEILSTWDRAIEQLEKLIAAKRRLKQGLMQQLLTGRRRFPEFGKPASPGRVPEDWKPVHLGDIARIRFSNVDKKSNGDEHCVRLCNYLDVYNNQYITADMSFMQATARLAEIEKYALRPGDVLITKDSETADDIANAATVVDELPGVICGYHLGILRPKRGVSGFFLGQLLMLPAIRYQFTRIANGVTRFGLGLTSVSKVPLWLPPHEEQERIATVLMQVDREIARLSRSIECFREQKRGLMQKLLTGQVRVRGAGTQAEKSHPPATPQKRKRRR
ncbi:MAG: hypothetical protein KatS3mg114_0461 [Planctomycetaceae bacterium]|nr:MAG: hypothetical protein KatS3mg114_0461 [Planctomycetaceae bacterium]